MKYSDIEFPLESDELSLVHRGGQFLGDFSHEILVFVEILGLLCEKFEEDVGIDSFVKFIFGDDVAIETFGHDFVLLHEIRAVPGVEQVVKNTQLF